MKFKLLGKKLGMTGYTEGNNDFPVTVLEVQGCHCFDEKDVGNNNSAYKFGYFRLDEKGVKRCNKAYIKSFKDSEPYKYVREMVLPTGTFEKGTTYSVEEIIQGIKEVDIVGLSKGRGFSGTMKKYNFSGLPKTHGVSRTHRSQGSIGCRRKPTKVLKNKKMPGRWGNEQITVKNLKLLGYEEGVIAIRGNVPGNKGGICTILITK